MIHCLLMLLLLAETNPAPRTVSVSATATHEVPADYVDLTLRVSNNQPDAVDAQRNNQAGMVELLAWLKVFGIPAADIATDFVNVNRVMLSNNPDTYGFEATCITRVRLKDLTKYDRFIQELFKGKALLDGVLFGISNKIEVQKQARIDAIKAAKEKAEYMVTVLGQRVGLPLNIDVLEGEFNGPMPESNMMYKAMPAGGGHVAQTLAPAPVVIEATVKVVFEIH